MLVAYILIFISAVFVNNIVFNFTHCPFLGVSKNRCFGHGARGFRDDRLDLITISYKRY